MAVCPLDGLTALLGEFHLHLAVLLDFLVGELYGLKHISLAHFLHLTLNHHDVVIGCRNHKVEVCLIHLTVCRVNLEFAVDADNPHL